MCVGYNGVIPIKRQQHCCEVENDITAIQSGPDFEAKNPFKRV